MIRQGICFDFDGTIIDSGEPGLNLLFRTARSRGLPITPEIEAKIRSIWGRSGIDLIKLAWPKENANAFYEAWEDLDNIEPPSFFPGVPEALAHLGQKFTLSILTNRRLKTVMPKIRDIHKLLSFVVTRDTLTHKKPDPRSMDSTIVAFAELGVLKENIIYVGDTVEGDVKLAQAVGIAFYAVLSGGIDSRDDFTRAGVAPDHIIGSVADLPAILI